MPPHVAAPSTAISAPNSRWGICGFTSVITALCENNIVSLGVPKAYVEDLELDVIAEYLNTLQRERSFLLIGEIDRFTRSFGPEYSGFTVSGFIQRIYNADLSKNFGVAMPLNGLLDFIERHGGRPRVVAADADVGNAILGLGSGEAGQPELGLKHWVFMVDKNTVYNYGTTEPLATAIARLAADVGKPMKVVYRIAL